MVPQALVALMRQIRVGGTLSIACRVRTFALVESLAELHVPAIGRVEAIGDVVDLLDVLLLGSLRTLETFCSKAFFALGDRGIPGDHSGEGSCAVQDEHTWFFKLCPPEPGVVGHLRPDPLPGPG